MKYVLLVLSLALWQLPYAQTSEIGSASGPGLVPIETATQAVQAALTFTGLDRYEELRVTAADDMAELMTFRESRIPTIGDSINGRNEVRRPVW